MNVINNDFENENKIELILIRHGRTKANDERRFLGSTDIGLTDEGAQMISEQEYPPVQILFSSPMKRCLETAKIIYPQMEPVVIDELREINFGRFENKNHAELDGDKDYQAYIDSNGTIGFPGGEDMSTYCEVVRKGLNKLRDIAKENKVTRAAAVVHGGTIMAAGYILGLSDYFDGIIGNGEVRRIFI